MSRPNFQRFLPCSHLSEGFGIPFGVFPNPETDETDHFEEDKTPKMLEISS
jgi:hypothetical protein